MFLALLRTHLKNIYINEPESGQKHIYAREHQLYCYIMFSDSEKQNTFSFINLKIQLNLFYTNTTDLCYNFRISLFIFLKQKKGPAVVQKPIKLILD